MNHDIPRIKELFEQLTHAAQPYIDTLKAHPLYDESFAENVSGRLYMKHTNKLDEEDIGKHPLPFMAEDEYNLFIDCSMFWRDVYRVYTDAVVTKINASKQLTDSKDYAEGLILDPDAQPLEEVLKDAEQAEEEAQALMRSVEDLRLQLSLLAWVRYIESFAGDQAQKKIMSDIKLIARGIERPFIYLIDEHDPEKGRMYQIDIDHEYFAGKEPVFVPHNINDRPFNRDELTEDLMPLFYYHLRALDYYKLPKKQANKTIDAAFTRLWGATEIKNYTTSAVDVFYFTKDKVSNQLTLLEPEITRTLGLESKKDKRKNHQIDVYVTLRFDELEESLQGNIALVSLNKLDSADRQVLDALVTVWANGEKTTTVQSIYRIITKNPNSRITPEKEEEILDRLRKLSRTHIKIDASAEAQYYGELRGTIEGAIASVTIDTAYVNNKLTYNAVHILDLNMSPVYRYAKIKEQIASVPFKMLDTKSANKNDETIDIERYLIDRIEAIYKDKKTGKIVGDTILIEKIFEAAGIYEEGQKDFKKKKQRTIKKITGLLDGYIETGYIKSYKINSKGKVKNYSITITLKAYRER